MFGPSDELFGDRSARGIVSAAEFVRRVTDACRDRHPGAEVQLAVGHSGRPSYLDVMWRDEQGILRRWPVGLASDGLDSELFEQFEAVHADYERRNPRVVSDLVVNGPPVREELRQQILRDHNIRLWSVDQYERLWDPHRYLAHQAEQLAADARYTPVLYVPQRFVRLEYGAHAPAEQPDLLGATLRWLGADDARLVLVLGDSGHGKSFLLRQLVRRIPVELPHLAPMLVDLRDVNKINNLDMLLTQHLAEAGEERIERRAVRRMLACGQVALLVDGFDELAGRLAYDEVSEHLDTLLSAVADRAKMVLASQEQHVYSDDERRAMLERRLRPPIRNRKVRIADFDLPQIRAFLVNFVRIRGGSEEQAEERFDFIRNIGELLDLSRKPRMLSVVAGLPVAALRTLQQRTGQISSAELYRLLVDQWLSSEADGAPHASGVSATLLDIQQLRAAVEDLALVTWQDGGDTVDISALGTTARSVFTDMSDVVRDGGRAYAFGPDSLLTRDGTRFSFTHHWVLEYLVTTIIARQVESSGGNSTGAGPLNHRPLSDQMVVFLCGAAKKTALAACIQRMLGDSNTLPIARDNALQVARELRLPIPCAQLAGQNLRGRDLSGLDLSYADLSRAILTGARLDDAKLTCADLQHADLRDAHLPGAKLVRAQVEGSMWDRAELPGAVADDAVMTYLRRAGARTDQMERYDG